CGKPGMSSASRRTLWGLEPASRGSPPVPYPSNAAPEQKEVAAAANVAPDARDHRWRTVRVDLNAPTRLVVLNEAHAERLAASARAEHRGAERRVAVPHHIQGQVRHLVDFWSLIDENCAVSLPVPHHSLNSGMSSSGLMSPRPTSFAKRGDRPTSGSAISK